MKLYCYKLAQDPLQIGAIITKWCITDSVSEDDD